MKRLFHYFQATFLAEGLLSFLRLSLLWGGLGWLLATSGIGQYFTSTLYAHDLQRSAHWAQERGNIAQPVLILIDDTAYESFFQGRSPVSRSQMRALLQTVAEHTPATTRVVLDIDLSPTPSAPEGQEELDAFLSQHPKRWVLPASQSGLVDVAERERVWRSRLCQAGVGFGLPYVPTEFGYPVVTHQYVNSLAYAAGAAQLPCADPTAPMVRTAMPLQGAALQAGQTLPFSGDLAQLASALDAMAPSAVVIGGAWGQSDVLGTPFGERYGVQVHAAAVAGNMDGERLASSWVELVVIWVFVSFISTLRGFFYEQVDSMDGHPIASLPGHAFFKQTGGPVVFLVCMFLLIMGFSELLAVLHAFTGYWISTASVACFSICTILLTWDMGRIKPVHYPSFAQAWDDVVLRPVKSDVFSLHQAALRLWGRPATWGRVEPGFALTRWQAVREGGLAFASLLSQTALPLSSLVFGLME